MADLNRNGWPNCVGISGRFQSEYALPDQQTQNLYGKLLFGLWEELLDNVAHFKSAVENKEETGDDFRREMREANLLGKPFVQQALVLAFLRLRDSHNSRKQKYEDSEIYRRINGLDWGTDAVIWQRVIMNGDKIASGRQQVVFASRFIAYLCGEHLERKQLDVLQDNYRKLFPHEEQKLIELPAAVFPPH